MKHLRIKRGDKLLGFFLCENVLFESGELYALNGGKIVGSIASGSGLSWEPIPLGRKWNAEGIVHEGTNDHL